MGVGPVAAAAATAASLVSTVTALVSTTEEGRVELIRHTVES